MITRIISWSLHNRIVVLAAAALLIVLGIHTAQRSPLDVFPEFAPPQIVIQTEVPGFSPEEVESLVTVPLENGLLGTSHLSTIRSSSDVGLSVITCIFEPDTEIFRARQLVAEKLQLAMQQLPEGAHEPEMTPLSSPIGIILRMNLTSQKTSLMDLRTLADWTIRPRLLAVSGVAQVIVMGGEAKQYQVIVDPQKLNDYQVTLEQVIAAAQGANWTAGAGYVTTQGQSLVIHGEGRIRSLDDLAASVINVREGVPVTIGQVARVQFGGEAKVGDASVDGRPCVFITVLKQPWANTLTVTRDVEQAVKGLRAALPPDATMATVFRQSNFIERSIDGVTTAMDQGGVLVLLVLLLFLLSWRAAFISFMAIPLSLLVAIIVLQGFGSTINTMTLGGLAIAVGEVVDDAIIDVENVFRRLRENRQKPQPDSLLSVVVRASTEVRGSIYYATLIVSLVFLPIFSLGGLEGRIFSPLGEAYITAIIASLLVALTATPVLCYFLLPKATDRERESLAVRWLQRKYQPILEWSLYHPWKILVASVALLALTLAIVPWLRGEFLPEFNEGNLVVHMVGLPETSLQESMRAGAIVQQRLHQIPEIATIVQRAGRAELDEDFSGTNASEFYMDLKASTRHRDQIVADVRRRLAEIPGYGFSIKQFISERIDEVLSGAKSEIVIKVFGPDLNTLRQVAANVEAAIAQVPGVVDLQVEQQIGVPKVLIQFNRSMLARTGLKSGDLARIIETALRGRVVAQVFEDQKPVPLLVRYDPPVGRDVEAIRHMLVDTPLGGKVPLHSLADVSIVNGAHTIEREDAQRRILVQANVGEGYGLSQVAAQIERRIATRVQLPVGYYIGYGGEFQAQASARQQLWFLGFVSVVGIFLLLFFAFRSLRVAALVMANLPLALIGGMVAIFLTGRELSVASLIGFITLFGIAARNGIMLLSHYVHLMKEEGLSFGKELVMKGSLERLRPILMTAVATGIALVPLAIGVDQPGRELEHPMAVVIIGGLVTSTLLNMIVIPTLYLRLIKPTLSEPALIQETEHFQLRPQVGE
jgi:CzcA family heavy metal efflux pump